MFKLFKRFTSADLICILCSLVFIIAQVWLDLTIPDYMSEITTLVRTDGSSMSDILAAGGKMLACAFGSLASSVVVAVFASRLGSNFSANLRRSIFSKVQSFSMQEIGGFSTAGLITRSTNDITQVQMFVTMGLQMIIKAPIMAAWAIMKIEDKSWQWTLSTAAAVAVLLIIVGICVALTLPKFKSLQKLTDNLNGVTRENLTGIRVVRAYNAESYQEQKFEKSNAELTNAHLFTSRTMSFMMPGIQLVSSGLALAIYWIGALLINNAAFPDRIALFSDMIVFSSYAMQVVMSFMMLVVIFIILPRASVSAKRISEVLETESKVVDGKGALTEKNGEVEFRNVSFRYPDAEEYVLHNISFTAHKGETVAFIGSTGCGKSTVINLIPRFYDATEGEVFVDGVNVKEYTQHQLHDKMGYVSQRAVLFTGTVRSNVAYGEFDGDVVSAVCTAQATDFVEGLEDTYDGYVAQGGTNLSGGQKQRLSIARAICRKPEILIFDDSFSALDYKTDRILREALKKECADATKLIVAQRIGTIRDADRIIVLDEGKAVGSGTHAKLMQSCEVYRQIALSQLSQEELV